MFWFDVVFEDDFVVFLVKVKVLFVMFEDGVESIVYVIWCKVDEFDYGYVLIVYKVQGLQWDNVVLFDESWVFCEYWDCWFYIVVICVVECIIVVR